MQGDTDEDTQSSVRINADIWLDMTVTFGFSKEEPNGESIFCHFSLFAECLKKPKEVLFWKRGE